MFSVGVLAFLFAGVLVTVVESSKALRCSSTMARALLLEGLSLALLLGVGFTVGSAGLALVERRMRPRSRRRSPAGRRTR